MVAGALQHLVYPASLPSHAANVRRGGGAGLSVLSYNVLLPNSVDGWWNYKMYSPPLVGPDQARITEWPYRRDLLRDRIGRIGADVVCLQEVSPKSFEQDFAFMRDDLGYDGVELFRKGRFRPATFWRTEAVDLVVPPVHKDRTLLTTFRPRRGRGAGAKEGEEEGDDDIGGLGRNWHVLNCHLQAGKNGGRRVRQVHEGVGAAVKLARRKLGEEDPKSPLLIVCGDFNGGPECGAVRYLEDGLIDPEFREDGEPVTSKVKKIALSAPMVDVASLPELGREPPPTLVVQELISLMIREGTEDTPELSADVVERLGRIYARYAQHDDDGGGQDKEGGNLVMGRHDVERWLVDINGQVGRGSEFRRAAREMGYVDPPAPVEASGDEGDASSQSSNVEEKPRITLPEDGTLSLEGFCRVYEAELREGKFWGIGFDLAIMGEALPDAGVFEARYDRMYFSSNVRTTCVIDTICTVPCPNESEPSDHLPLAASFEIC